MSQIINRFDIANAVMPFGKYRGIAIKTVKKKHKAYFEWLKTNAYGDFKELIEKVEEEINAQDIEKRRRKGLL